MATKSAGVFGLLVVYGLVACGGDDEETSVVSSSGGTGGGLLIDAGAGRSSTTSGGRTGTGGRSSQTTGGRAQQAAGAAGQAGGGGQAGAAQAGEAGSENAGTAGAGGVVVAGSGSESSGQAGRGTGGKAPTGGKPATGGAPAATGGAGGVAGVAGAEPVSCHGLSDCPEGQVCGAYRSGTFYCTEPGAGASLGESCDADYVTDECEDRICLPFSNQCSRLCTDDVECGAPESGFVCVDYGQERACMEVCRTSSECSEGQVCSLVANQTANRYDWVCSLPRGEVAAGETPADGDCSQGGDCANGLCLTFTKGEEVSYYCTLPCQDAKDCPPELSVCGRVTMSLWDDTTQTTRACTPE